MKCTRSNPCVIYNFKKHHFHSVIIWTADLHFPLIISVCFGFCVKHVIIWTFSHDNLAAALSKNNIESLRRRFIYILHVCPGNNSRLTLLALSFQKECSPLHLSINTHYIQISVEIFLIKFSFFTYCSFIFSLILTFETSLF